MPPCPPPGRLRGWMPPPSRVPGAGSLLALGAGPGGHHGDANSGPHCPGRPAPAGSLGTGATWGRRVHGGGALPWERARREPGSEPVLPGPGRPCCPAPSPLGEAPYGTGPAQGSRPGRRPRGRYRGGRVHGATTLSPSPLPTPQGPARTRSLSLGALASLPRELAQREGCPGESPVAPPWPAVGPGRPEGGWTPAGVARFPRGLARGDTGWHAFQLGANSPPRGHPPGLRPSLGPLELAAGGWGPGAGREGGDFPWSHTYRGPTGLQPPVPHTPCMPPVPSASPPRATAGSLGTLAPLRPGIRGFQRGWLPWGGYRGRGQGVPGAGGPLFRANTGRNRGGSRLPRARPPSPRTGTRGNSPVLPPRGGQPAPGPSPASPGLRPDHPYLTRIGPGRAARGSLGR